MTTDIVTRLRAVAETGCDPDLPHDAAAEIERLREALAIKTALLDQSPKNMAKLARIAAILEPLRALEAAATDAPWHVQGQGGIRMDGVRDSYVIQGGQADVCKSPTRPGRDRNPEGERVNFQCIAAARNALPALLREIQETP